MCIHEKTNHFTKRSNFWKLDVWNFWVSRLTRTWTFKWPAVREGGHSGEPSWVGMLFSNKSRLLFFRLNQNLSNKLLHRTQTLVPYVSAGLLIPGWSYILAHSSDYLYISTDRLGLPLIKTINKYSPKCFKTAIN